MTLAVIVEHYLSVLFYRPYVSYKSQSLLFDCVTYCRHFSIEFFICYAIIAGYIESCSEHTVIMHHSAFFRDNVSVHEVVTLNKNSPNKNPSVTFRDIAFFLK